MTNIEQQYLALVSDIIENGIETDDRTGVGTISVFGRTIRHDLSKGFPLLTHKSVPLHAVLAELYWFLEGSTDERRLAEITYGKPREELIGKTTIWTANADNQGVALGYKNTPTFKELGPVYGCNFRDWTGGYDQIRNLIEGLKTNPNSRRHIVSAWNVGDLEDMALPPCHMMTIWSVKDGKLNCMMLMRSSDTILGVPFNIASYAALTHIIAREVGLGVGDLVITMADVHIYKNHVEGAREILTRETFDFPTLKIADDFDLNAILDGKTPFDIKGKIYVENYQNSGKITLPMAV